MSCRVFFVFIKSVLPPMLWFVFMLMVLICLQLLYFPGEVSEYLYLSIYIYQILRGIENTGLVLEKFVLGHASGMNSQAALASTVKKLTINEIN